MRRQITFYLLIVCLLSGCTSNLELLAEAKPFYQEQKAVINKQCSSCSYMFVRSDGGITHNRVSSQDQDKDSYTIKDVRFASLFDTEDYYARYYLTAENDREVSNRKNAIKRESVKNNTFEMEMLEFRFPVHEYRFPISESQLKNHEFPEILDKDAYKKKVEDDRKKAIKQQAEEKRLLAERNREINRIKNNLHSQGCNRFWDYSYGDELFVDYLVNLKFGKENQIYCQKDVYGMDIFVYVKSPHRERIGVGLIADNSDKTLYRKSWEEDGEIYKCNKILCEDPLSGIDTLGTLFLFSLM